MTLPFAPRSFKKAEAVASHPLEDGLVVGLLESDQVFAFNPTAREIWEACEGRLSLKTLYAWLSEKHKITETTVQAEVLPFLERLKTAGLLLEEEEPHA